MSIFFGILAAIAFFVGVFGAANIRSDIQIIIAILGFGFAGVFVGFAAIIEMMRIRPVKSELER